MNGNFIRCRGYDEKEVERKLAGRNIRDVAKEQWLDRLVEPVLAAMGDGWDSLAHISSRVSAPYASKTYVVLQALCRAGQVERDPPLGLRPSGAGMQHGARWRKVNVIVPTKGDRKTEPEDGSHGITDRQKLMLETMLATGTTSAALKRDFGILHKHGLTESTRGPDGGVWLTKKGVLLAKKN